jgi:TonB family protein
MDPLSDDELSSILHKLEVSPAPDTLEARIFGAQNGLPKAQWWRRAIFSSVRIPVPVLGVAGLAFFALAAFAFRVNRPVVFEARNPVATVQERGAAASAPAVATKQVTAKSATAHQAPTSEAQPTRESDVKPQNDSQRAVRLRDGTLSVPPGAVDHNLMTSPEPTYPAEANATGLQGIVKLQVRIDTDGHVSEATVVSGNPALVPAAIEAVKQRTYRPTLLNGNPIAVVTQVDVTFRLDVTLTSTLMQ